MMSYIWGLDSSEYRLVSIVSISNDWRVMIADNDRADFYTAPIVALAHVENRNGSKLLCPIINSGSIGGEWECICVPGEKDDSIGIIGPGEDFPNDAEIKVRLEIIKEEESISRNEKEPA